MEALSKFAAIGFASLGLLLGWLGAVVGFLLLACGIAGAIVGQVIWVLGCNEVTRHDAVVSVRAGFTGNELSAAWPPGDWQLEERVAWPFTHLFIARES